MRIFVSIVFILYFLTAKAQETIVISGTVRDAKTNDALDAINVMLQCLDGKLIYGFALTNAQGYYSIKYKGDKDTLSIAISGFNVKKESKNIRRISQQVNFMAESTDIAIREVVIKARPIERSGDTITYNVSSFINLTDHSISDVLRKMPGIEVEKNGKIKYNGLDISKFYIEGLDMFEGHYGIATNNIQAKDIARVEVMENHQPIKVLKELTLPERAAINLRLKSSSSGIWNGSAQAGLGYKPALWNAEVTGMYFGHKFQNLNLYKTNNTGDDVSGELSSHYDNEEELPSLIGIHKPSAPSIKEERYLDNNIHLFSTSAINKLKKGVTLGANAYYMHDFQNSQSKTVTTYYQPSSQPLIISEITKADLRTDRAKVNMHIESNAETYYLKDRVEFSGRWEHDSGNLLNDKNEVRQRFKRSDIAIRNDFEGTRKIGKLSIHLSSLSDYRTAPMTLCITPMLYPEIFSNAENLTGAIQQVDAKRFRTQNSVYTSYSVKRWNFYLKADANAHLEWMQSSLLPLTTGQENNAGTDDMHNDTYWGRLDLLLGPSVSYFSKSLYASVDCPFDVMNLKMKDRIRNDNSSQSKLFFRPRFNATLTLTRNLKFSVHASYQEDYGGLYDSYGGLIMTDYRVITNKRGGISHTRQQHYYTSINYANILKAIFGSLTASYYSSRRNLMYGTTYEGSLSRVEAINMPNTTNSYTIHGRISKRFNSIGTTFNLASGYSRSWSDILRENRLMPTCSEQFRANIGANIRFCPSLLLDYNANYIWNQYHIQDETELEPIHTIQQDATLSFIINKKIVYSIHAEHYYNGVIETGNRNMFFVDSKLLYRTRRMEYSLETRNLLAKKNFYSASYSDATNFMQVYRLRPPSIMFKLKFYFY